MALVVLVVGGTWVYINLIKDDPPAELSFEERDEATAATDARRHGRPDDGGHRIDHGRHRGSHHDRRRRRCGVGRSTGHGRPPPSPSLGYRVKEVLFGQVTEGVGRTNAVTGSLSARRHDRRVGRVHGGHDDGGERLGQPGQPVPAAASWTPTTFPTSTFTLTQPIELETVPAEGETVTATATGDLTLRGTTLPVTFDVQARLNAGNIEVDGSIPIVFADWGIPNPSFGPASTEDNGLLEFLLVFSKG